MTRDRFRAPGVIVPDIDEVEWDDEADIICVGTGSAALAVAVAADADGLDVLLPMVAERVTPRRWRAGSG